MKTITYKEWDKIANLPFEERKEELLKLIPFLLS